MNYVNKYNCTAPENRSSLMVTFSQLHPVFDYNNEEEAPETGIEEITSLVMDSEVALSLADAIIDIFSSNETVEKK